MPVYDYECESCERQFEEFRKIDDRLDMKCPSCQGSCKMIISRAPADHTFQPFWHDDFTHGEPILVKSKAHYKDLCKKHGVYAPHVFGQGWNISEV